MTIKDAVVARFTAICDARDIRTNELATLSGVTPSTAYSMMDNSRQDISIKTIKKFCDGLNISIKEFFDDPIFDGLDSEIR